MPCSTMSKRLRRPAIRWVAPPFFAVLIFLGPPLAAEFHVFTDPQGQRRISNIPPQGIGQNGEIRRGYDPRQLPAQQRRLVEQLRAEDARLERLERERTERDQTKDEAQRQATVNPAAPTEGFLDLQELIELERRGGRYQADN